MAGVDAPTFSIPDGVRAYAVGDIHGHLDFLLEIQALIDRDSAAQTPAKVVEIYLGDYIDRGPQSAGVIEHLCQPRPHRTVFLRGNHEDYPEAFLAGEDNLAQWLRNGGANTLASYGVSAGPTARADTVRRAFRAALPANHRTFLASLNLGYRLGEVFFVHAGIRPGVALDAQAREDLVMIRREFIENDPPLPVRVVHGHTPQREPQVRPYRIGVDTG
ncbi:MAG: metallophosphoesterase family protein, partial [Pseudomonadota bacterium]